LCAYGALPLRGGDFDAWDLQVRGGPLGSARMFAALEYHGDGRQLLRIRSWPRCSAPAVVLTLTFAALSAGAAADHAWDACFALGAVALFVGVAVLTQLRDFANALLTAYTGEKLLRSFRAQLFRHVQRLSFSYHDIQGTADSSYRIQYDAAAVQKIIVDSVVPFLTSA